jgi:LAS superfamily LD-carboxypeptidase LdcB
VVLASRNAQILREIGMTMNFKKDSSLALKAQLLGQSVAHLAPLNKDESSPLIHKELVFPYSEMVAAASKDNIVIEIASGFRSFDRQLAIFNNKFTGKTDIKDKENNIVDITTLSELEILHAILLYSALPGASRHHWGCDIDVYAPNLLNIDETLQLEPWEYEEKGPMHKLNIWLSNYACDFGFYRPYQTFQGGVAEEPWHLSYKPIADIYMQSFDIKTLKECIENSSIKAKKTILENLPLITKRYIQL